MGRLISPRQLSNALRFSGVIFFPAFIKTKSSSSILHTGYSIYCASQRYNALLCHIHTNLCTMMMVAIDVAKRMEEPSPIPFPVLSLRIPMQSPLHTGHQQLVSLQLMYCYD